MKQCTYCGRQYPDEATICAIDHQPLSVQAPPPFAPPLERQHIIDDEHLKMLAVFHFVFAGLAALGVVFLLFHFLMMSMLFANPAIWRNQPNAPEMPQAFVGVFACFYFVFGSILVLACLLNFLSAMFLRRQQHRTFSLVVAGLNCLQIPFGTVLGVFTIIVLSRTSVSQRYTVNGG